MTTPMILINAILSAAVITVIVGGCLYAIRSSRRIADPQLTREPVPATRPERPRQRPQVATRGVRTAASAR